MGSILWRTIHFDTESWKITTLSVSPMWVGEGERLTETVAVASRSTARLHVAAVQECAHARRRHCANSSLCAFCGSDCECSLCRRAVSQNECLLEIKLSPLHPCDPSRRPKRLHPEPPSSVAFRVQMRRTPPATRCRRFTPSNSLCLC